MFGLEMIKNKAKGKRWTLTSLLMFHLQIMRLGHPLA